MRWRRKVRYSTHNTGDTRSPIASLCFPPGEDSFLFEYVTKPGEDTKLGILTAAVIEEGPGAFTWCLPLVQEKYCEVGGICSGGENKMLGVRICDNKKLNAALTLLERPLLSTSLNMTGEKPAGTYEEARLVCQKMGIPVVKFEEELKYQGKPSTLFVYNSTTEKLECKRDGAGKPSEEKRIAKLFSL